MAAATSKPESGGSWAESVVVVSAASAATKAATSARSQVAQNRDGHPIITACGSLSGEYEGDCNAGSDEVHVIGDSVLWPVDTARLDLTMATFLSHRDIPNAAVAVVARDGRLVYVRGFTNCAAYAAADETPYYAGPDSKFRIGSVSKILTALGVLKADELGLLQDSVDSNVGTYVDLETIPQPTEGVAGFDVDSKLSQLRVSHCLTHTGGWVRAAVDVDTDGNIDGVFPLIATSDFVAGTLAGTYGIADPPGELRDCAQLNYATWPTSPVHLLRYGNLAQVSFTPGERYCYSNYGYWLLGWVIEGASCRGYESFIREFVLKPIGAQCTEIADSELRLRKVGEVPYFTEYWPWQDEDWVYTEMESRWTYYGSEPRFDADDSETVYNPYGERNIRVAAATGGWVSSAYDLALLMRDLFVGPSTILTATGGLGAALKPRFCTNSSGTTAETYSGFIRTSGGSDQCTSNATIVGFEKSGHLNGAHAYIRNFGRIEAQQGQRVQAAGHSVVFLFNRYYEEGSDWRPTVDQPAKLRSAFGLLEIEFAARVAAITSWGGTDDLFR